MSPEQREAFLDAAMSSVDKKNRPQWAYEFNYLTRRGFSISLASVRDHTNCEFGCENGVLPPLLILPSEPCPGGSPVVWSTEP